MKIFCFCTQHASWIALVNHSQSCYQWHYTLVFWQIKDTVGFDTLGHCFFLEDGIEQRNTLFHNLGLLTKPGTLLPTDRNNSMCITMREKVFGNYIPVPATDCMWVIGGVKSSHVMAKATEMTKIAHIPLFETLGFVCITKLNQTFLKQTIWLSEQKCLV